jgi:hypothetical protein
VSIADAIDRAMDGLRDGGTAEVEEGGIRAEVEVVEADRIGARVRRIRVERQVPYALGPVADHWPKQLKDLPDRVIPIEVDPGLGGATLRTDPDDRSDDRFIEVHVRGATTDIRRHRVVDGNREPADWAMTREGLRRILDTLSQGS